MFLIDFPIVQVGCIMCSNLVFIFYMYKAKPMIHNIQNWNIISDEILLLVSNIGFCLFIYLDMTEEDKISMGWGICVLMTLSIIKNLTITLKFVTLSVKEWWRIRKLKKLRKKQLRDSPIKGFVDDG